MTDTMHSTIQFKCLSYNIYIFLITILTASTANGAWLSAQKNLTGSYVYYTDAVTFTCRAGPPEFNKSITYESPMDIDSPCFTCNWEGGNIISEECEGRVTGIGSRVPCSSHECSADPDAEMYDITLVVLPVEEGTEDPRLGTWMCNMDGAGLGYTLLELVPVSEVAVTVINNKEPVICEDTDLDILCVADCGTVSDAQYNWEGIEESDKIADSLVECGSHTMLGSHLSLAWREDTGTENRTVRYRCCAQNHPATQQKCDYVDIEHKPPGEMCKPKGGVDAHTASGTLISTLLLVILLRDYIDM